MKSLIKKASEALSEAQEGQLRDFCDKNHLYVENPVYFDYMKFRTYMCQLEKCRNCDGSIVACSARQIYVENGHLKTIDTGCPVRAAKQIIKYSAVPVKFKDWRLENLVIKRQNSESIGKVTAAIRNRDSLYIWGAAGTGKTLVSSVVANERAYQGGRSTFCTVTDMLDDLRDYMDAFRREEKLLRLRATPCLIIDDMGAENVTEWVASTLFSIIDFRYKNNLQTIINSNFDVNDLCKRYPAYHGERISRRIRAMSKIIYLI